MFLSEFLQVYLPTVANVAVIISVIASVLVPLLSIRQKTKRSKSDVLITEIEENNREANVYNNIYRNTIGVSYMLLKRLYENTHRQANSWFIFSGIIASIGILVIASIFIMPPSAFYYNISIPSTMFGLGVLLNLIAISSFFQARQKNKIIDEYCSEKFLEADKISQLISLIAENPDAKARDHFKEKVISQILIPMKVNEREATHD